MRIYYKTPISLVLQKYIDSIFFIKTSKEANRDIIISPCTNPTLYLYRNVNINIEEGFYSVKSDSNANSFYAHLFVNQNEAYIKKYIGIVDEIAIVFKDDRALDKFVNKSENINDFVRNVTLLGNADFTLNSLFDIKGYRRRQPYLEDILLNQYKKINHSEHTIEFTIQPKPKEFNSSYSSFKDNFLSY